METGENARELPFRAIVRAGSDDAPSAEAGSPVEDDTAGGSDDELSEDLMLPEDLSDDDFEAAYLRALEVVDAALDETGETGEADAIPADDPGVTADLAHDPVSESDLPPSTPSIAPAADLVAQGEDEPAAAGEPTRATSRQVVEALLFVGGAVLTSRKLAELLGGGFTNEQVEEIVDRLNADYAAEGRPYAIHWGEGGYRYQLRPEFEKIRNRVFGVGPRAVKLSQEALEILALVAYRQPLSSADLEATQRKNAGSILRQLIRRELVELRRSGSAPDEPTYHTTPRFLELFGLTSLDDLPFPADFSFK